MLLENKQAFSISVKKPAAVFMLSLKKEKKGKKPLSEILFHKIKVHFTEKNNIGI